MNKLKEYRKKMQMSQGQLAKSLQISQTFLSKVESGKVKMRLELAQKAAKLVRAEVKEVFPDIGKNTPQKSGGQEK